MACKVDSMEDCTLMTAHSKDRWTIGYVFSRRHLWYDSGLISLRGARCGENLCPRSHTELTCKQPVCEAK